MPRRDSRPGDARFLEVRVALFGAAAILWLTGLLLGLEFLTPVAIVILLAAAVLGLLARRIGVPADTEEVENEEDRHP